MRPFCVLGESLPSIAAARAHAETLLWAPACVVELDDVGSRAALAGITAGGSDALRKAAAAAKAEVKPRFRFVGIGSTDGDDFDGDSIDQDGLDLRPFLRTGFVNDDHGKTAGAILGYPTRAWRTTVIDNGKRLPATAIEGYLFDTPLARERAELAMAMDGTDRQMGLSLEGPPPTRSPANPKRIVRAVVTHVALTPWPVNDRAKVSVLAKSLTASALLKSASAGYPRSPGNMQPVMPESLDGHAVNASIDVERLRRMLEGWDPADTLRKKQRLSKALASHLIRRRFPGASPTDVERIIRFAQANGAQR